MLGLLKFQFLNQEKRIETKDYKDNYIFPFVVGAAFAFGWTPCIGPILGSILALSATEASISKGILLLSFYSLGLAIPFILSGYFMSRFLTSKKNFSKYYNRVTKTGGTILLITGILITTNQIQVISYYILTTFPFLTTLGLMSDITILGIFVADISFSGNKIPTIGETILGDSYNIGPGGKGCNQAIAISRLGRKS